MEDGEVVVTLGKLEVGVDDLKLPGVFEGVGSEAEEVEDTPQCPHICLLADRLVAVEVHHLRGAVHGRGVALNLGIHGD